MPDFDVSFAVGSTAFAFLLVIYIRQRVARGTTYSWPLPPGPARLPLIGNLLDIPNRYEWETYRKWAKDLDTDIVHLDVMGKHIIILDSFEVANDLLEKRSSNYSSRTDMIMANDLMGWDFDFAFQPYGNGWREYRRMFHHEFHPLASKRFHPYEIQATHTLLRNLIDTPEKLLNHLRQLAGSVVLGIAYGLEISSPDDPYIKLSEEAVGALLVASIPGAFLVDSMPWLKHIPSWFPGAGFQRKAKEWRKLTERMYEEPYVVAKQLMAKGTNEPSFISARLASLDERVDPIRQETIIQHLAGTMYAAGSDSTAAAVGFFVQGILSNSSVIAKGREEIDRVIGNDRLPDFDDEPSLPYISAIVKETLRWRSVTPIAIPHMSTQEDIYKGYRIPAGAIIIPNAWSMLHDENYYSEPWKFNPDRFMKDGKLNKDVKDPVCAAFGFGRRICPARFMALHTLWIAVASIIATLDIRNPVDELGNEVETPLDYIPGLVCAPAPTRCLIKPRSSRAEELIQSTTT